MSIGFRGAGAQVATVTSGGSLSPALPTGWAPGDLHVLVIAGRPSGTAGSDDTFTVAGGSGWTQVGSRQRREVGTVDLMVEVWYRFAQSGDTAPSVSALGSAFVGGTTEGLSAFVVGFTGVDATTPLDGVTPVGGNAAAATTWTAPQVTPASSGSWVISVVASADDNALNHNTAHGFTLRASGASYDTTTGSDHAVGVASKPATTAGVAETMCVWNQSAVSNDAWVGLSFVLRPEPFVDPSSIPGLTGWWDASEETGFADGDPVGTLTDQSGNGRHLTSSGSARPTFRTSQFGSLPGIEFDGTDDYLSGTSLGALIGLDAGTVFAVFKAVSIGTDDTVDAYKNDPVWNDDGPSIGGHAGVGLRSGTPETAAWNYDGGTEDVVTQTISTGDTVIHCWRHGSATLYASIDGGTEGSAASSTTGAGTEPFKLGGNFHAFANIVVAGVVTYNRSLDAGELADVVSYLDAKWNQVAGGVPEIYFRSGGSFTKMAGVYVRQGGAWVEETATGVAVRTGGSWVDVPTS